MDNNDYIKARGEKGGCKEREKAKQERQRWREKESKQRAEKERTGRKETQEKNVPVSSQQPKVVSGRDSCSGVSFFLHRKQQNSL